MAALALSPIQSRWVNFVQSNVVPNLAGSAEERARTAALVTWWALKEGIMNLPNPWRHNLCSQPGAGGDVQIGDLGVCSGPAWQIGLSGIQGNAVTLAQAESTAQRLYAGQSLPTILARITRDASLDDATARTVIASEGALRKAWLLRDPAIAFTLQRPFVEAGCLTGNASWCHGGWDTARAFAGTPQRVREVIDALEDQFAGAAKNLLPWLVIAAGLGLAGYGYWRERR